MEHFINRNQKPIIWRSEKEAVVIAHVAEGIEAEGAE